jgi:ElaB/YqjD/DUF883 family membrane-anchored ribosome-binding protein
MDPRIESTTRSDFSGNTTKLNIAKNEARSFVERAGDTVKGTVKNGYDTVKHAADDAIVAARDLPEHVTEYTRALDKHVHQNPRMHVGIMAGVGVLLGALFGGKVVKWGLLAAAAYGVTKLIPRDLPQKLLSEAKR